MAVKIGDKVFRNEQEQVQKNMKDIEVLKQYIKEAYKCSSELTSSTDQVLKSSTNAGEDVTSGWLMDSIGNLFTITGGDDTYLLLDFFTSLRGPQGEDGAAVSIDDSTTSATKCWSSQKTNSEFTQVKGMGVVYATSATPTVDDDTYIFNKTDFITEPIPSWTSIIGKQVCQIVDSKIKYIYSVVSTSESTITCVLIGEVGGGKQSYLHNIKIYDNSGWICYIQIINNSNTAFTGVSLYNFLIDNGFNGTNRKSYQATGVIGGNVIHSIASDSSNHIYFNHGTSGTEKAYTVVQNNLSDYIITL